MISLKLNKSNILYLVILGLLVYIFMTGGTEEIEVKIPSKENTVKISDPIPDKKFDTIFKDSIVRRDIVRLVSVKNPVNEELLQKYEEAVKENDSLKQAEIFKDAITERTYTETLKDSVQIITVKSEVIGTLKSQTISYKTKPISFSFKVKEKTGVFIGAFSYIPTIEGGKISVGLQLQIANKKRILTLGLDNQKTILVGVTIKLF